MGNNLKDNVKQMFYNYASPVPYMVRNGWEPVAEYGASKPALANVARGYYDKGLENLLNNIDMIKNPLIWQWINEAKNRNNHYMLQNEMRYNPDFLDGTY